MVYGRKIKKDNGRDQTSLLPFLNFPIRPSLAPINIIETEVRENCKPNNYSIRILLDLEDESFANYT